MTAFRRNLTAFLSDRNGQSPVLLTDLDAACTLDEGWAPYAQADLVVKIPSLAALARISDLSTRSRVVFTVETMPPPEITGPSTYRSFDLGIIARQVNHRAGTVSLALASDEALLQDYAHTGLTPDMGLRPLQRSVRNMVNYVLTKALGPTTSVQEANDFDFTTYTSARNVWSYKLGKTSYTIPAQSATALVGNDSIAVVPNNTGVESFAFVNPGLQPGATYTMSATVSLPAVQQGTLNSRARRMVLVTQIGGVYRVSAQSPQVPNIAGTTQRVSFTFTVPENVTAQEIRLYSGAQSNGRVNFNDIVILEGDGLDEFGEPIGFFDGDTPATTGYTYSWDGDANVSTSTRTPRLNRSPEILIWSPGQTAWDLLKPILEASGLRLWCDELGGWHLTTSTYSRPGTVTAHAGVELYDAIDLVSRTASQSSGVPLYVDAVIVRYTWVDEKGNDRERFDVATTTGFIKPFTVERPETPFPGSGAATYLLRRYMQRRRQVPVTRSLLPSTNPGQTVTIKVGDGSTLTGYLDAVTFDFGADEMSLKTKDLS